MDLSVDLRLYLVDEPRVLRDAGFSDDRIAKMLEATYGSDS